MPHLSYNDELSTAKKAGRASRGWAGRRQITGRKFDMAPRGAKPRPKKALPKHDPDPERKPDQVITVVVSPPPGSNDRKGKYIRGRQKWAHVVSVTVINTYTRPGMRKAPRPAKPTSGVSSARPQIVGNAVVWTYEQRLTPRKKTRMINQGIYPSPSLPGTHFPKPGEQI